MQFWFYNKHIFIKGRYLLPRYLPNRCDSCLLDSNILITALCKCTGYSKEGKGDINWHPVSVKYREFNISPNIGTLIHPYEVLLYLSGWSNLTVDPQSFHNMPVEVCDASPILIRLSSEWMREGCALIGWSKCFFTDLNKGHSNSMANVGVSYVTNPK